MEYTFAFNGELTVEASSEKEAYDKAEDLLGNTPYQDNYSVDFSVYEINCIDKN